MRSAITAQGKSKCADRLGKPYTRAAMLNEPLKGFFLCNDVFDFDLHTRPQDPFIDSCSNAQFDQETKCILVSRSLFLGLHDMIGTGSTG